MNYLIVFAIPLAAFLAAVCSEQTVQAEANQASSDSINYVAKECDQKLMDINSLARFEQFMSHYEAVVSRSTKPKRGLLNSDKGLRKCYDIGDQLRALRQILAQRQKGVCNMNFVDQLVDFHAKYLVGRDEQHPETTNTNSSHFVAHIFSLIAHQVALTCKSHLGERLEELQSRHSCDQIIASFLPPGIMNGRAGEIENQEPNSMSGFLQHFARVEDLELITRRQSANKEPYFDVIVSPEVLSRIDELKRQCNEREPHYINIFAPIVSLSQIGYQIPDELLDNDGGVKVAPEVLKCWLATAQLCQGILRTHINVKESEEESREDDGDDGSAEKKLIEIKFGPAPSDVDIESAQSAEQSVGDLPIVTFDELSPKVIDLAKRRASLKQKIKRRMVNWAKKFVENHIDIEGLREESARNFMDALTRDHEAEDSAVAFAGAKRNQGLYLAPRLVADDADTIVQTTSFFVPKGIAIFFSSAVAICLSAVFLWFSLYALVTTLTRSNLPDSSGNFKDDWRKLRDERMKTIDDKVKRKGWKDKMMIYSSPSG